MRVQVFGGPADGDVWVLDEPLPERVHVPITGAAYTRPWDIRIYHPVLGEYVYRLVTRARPGLDTLVWVYELATPD